MIKRKNLTAARVVGHSKHSISGKEIATLVVTLPRIVLAELNTHRAFSRNSGSSRAIPYSRMKKSVKKNLFIPLAFQKHHKGMQGTEYYATDSFMDKFLVLIWFLASRMAILTSSILYKCGATKQLANRILEPFMWHTVVVTATEWEGFFRQRCPKYELNDSPEVFRSWSQFVYNFQSPEVRNELCDYSLTKKLEINRSGAEIHIALAAEAIYDSLRWSEPVKLTRGQWHIPFENVIRNYDKAIRSYLLSQTSYWDEQSQEEGKDEFLADLQGAYIKIATAICARVSFTSVGDRDIGTLVRPKEDIKLHDRLIADEHMSPTEHCAQVAPRTAPGMHSNFKGSWIQYRKMVEKDLIR